MIEWSGLDAAGRRRSPGEAARLSHRPAAATSGCGTGRPPTVDEIVAVMRHVPNDRHGWRVHAMIVVLWRAGLRIQEAACARARRARPRPAARLPAHPQRQGRPSEVGNAPLRTAIFEDSTGAAWFSVDQPSTHFASLGISEVTEVGIELDRKLAALLQALDMEVPEPLLES